MRAQIGCQLLANLNCVNLGNVNTELCLRKLKEHVSECPECKKAFEDFLSETSSLPVR